MRSWSRRDKKTRRVRGAPACCAAWTAECGSRLSLGIPAFQSTPRNSKPVELGGFDFLRPPFLLLFFSSSCLALPSSVSPLQIYVGSTHSVPELDPCLSFGSLLCRYGPGEHVHVRCSWSPGRACDLGQPPGWQILSRRPTSKAPPLLCP